MGDIINSYFGEIAMIESWDEVRPWLPHRCVFTSTWIMPFTKARAMHGVRYYRNGSDHYWTTADQLIISKLKGDA